MGKVSELIATEAKVVKIGDAMHGFTIGDKVTVSLLNTHRSTDYRFEYKMDDRITLVGFGNDINIEFITDKSPLNQLLLDFAKLAENLKAYVEDQETVDPDEFEPVSYSEVDQYDSIKQQLFNVGDKVEVIDSSQSFVEDGARGVVMGVDWDDDVVVSFNGAEQCFNPKRIKLYRDFKVGDVVTFREGSAIYDETVWNGVVVVEHLEKYATREVMIYVEDDYHLVSSDDLILVPFEESAYE